MSTYDAMRQFADSWGLLGMVIFFIAAVISTLLPGARENAARAAQLPFIEDAPEPDCCGTSDGTGPCARLAGLFEEDDK